MLVPVKAFRTAKVRLSAALDADRRAQLARGMAERVLEAAAPLPVWCVCDDAEVADWAAAHGATAEWTPGRGLNGAVQEAVARRRADGFARVIVAHGDLPFAAGLASLAVVRDDEVVLVPDRRGEGTNVVSVPTTAGFVFAYGPDSLARHVTEARRCGLTPRTEVIEHLGWDVDRPEDLEAPAHLGTLPAPTPSGAAGADR